MELHYQLNEVKTQNVSLFSTTCDLRETISRLSDEIWKATEMADFLHAFSQDISRDVCINNFRGYKRLQKDTNIYPHVFEEKNAKIWNRKYIPF